LDTSIANVNENISNKAAAEEAGKVTDTSPAAKGGSDTASQVSSEANALEGGVKNADIAVRKAYVNKVRDLNNLEQALKAEGKNAEEIARILHQARRDLGVQFKDMTSPEMLEQIYKRNMNKYGDKLGPTIDYLRSKGKTWEQIIESAKTPGQEFNDIAGIK